MPLPFIRLSKHSKITNPIYSQVLRLSSDKPINVDLSNTSSRLPGVWTDAD